ncbi:MAG: KaiC domain-containing protein [Thermoproteota archaeon]
MERLATGVPGFDKLIEGGIPRGFFVAVVGEPGTGKTVFSIHFIAEGLREGDKCIYVTTEESRESIISQAALFGFDFESAIQRNQLVIVDALMGSRDDYWSLRELDVEELVQKVIEAKKFLGYGRSRLVIDSMSAFWLDKPAMARRYSYYVKRVLHKWDFTTLATSQYAVTTSLGFGFGIEHVADGVIRFRKVVSGGQLRRYVIVEKMRLTEHSLQMHEIAIRKGEGMAVLRPVALRREDIALPSSVATRMTLSELQKILETLPLGEDDSRTAD